MAAGERWRDPAIRLSDVSCDVFDKKNGQRTVLRRASAIVPSSASIAVMGPDPNLLTVFLNLLAGSDVPDHGRVSTDDIKFSPIVNAGGAASTLVPQLSAIDNIHFFAMRYDIAAAALVRVVDLACRLGPLLNDPIRSLDVGKRRAIEVALIAAIPYDCYLVDRLDILLPEQRWLMAHSARVREAGMIYVTQDVRLAKQFGGAGFVIENGKFRRHAELARGFGVPPDVTAKRRVAVDG